MPTYVQVQRFLLRHEQRRAFTLLPVWSSTETALLEKDTLGRSRGDLVPQSDIRRNQAICLIKNSTDAIAVNIELFISG